MMILHTHMMPSYLWSLIYDHNNLFMPLLYFFLFNLFIYFYLQMFLKNTMYKLFWENKFYFRHCRLDIPDFYISLFLLLFMT